MPLVFRLWARKTQSWIPCAGDFSVMTRGPTRTEPPFPMERPSTQQMLTDSTTPKVSHRANKQQPGSVDSAAAPWVIGHRTEIVILADCHAFRPASAQSYRTFAVAGASCSGRHERSWTSRRPDELLLGLLIAPSFRRPLIPVGMSDCRIMARGLIWFSFDEMLPLWDMHRDDDRELKPGSHESMLRKTITGIILYLSWK